MPSLIQLNKLINNKFYSCELENIMSSICSVDPIRNDTPESWGTFFQDNATPQMEGLEELHNNIMFYLAIILFAVNWIIISIVINFKNKRLFNKHVKHNGLVEIIWTISPALILMLVVFPSFKLLYLMDEVIDPILVIRGEGNHWYWDFQYLGYNLDYAGYAEDIHIYSNNEYPDFYHTLMDKATEFPKRWGFHNRTQDHLVDDCASGMPEYVAALKPYQGKTLRELYITLEKSAYPSRLNQLTWEFHKREPNAFLYYDPDSTKITPNFLHLAMTSEIKHQSEIDNVKHELIAQEERKEMKEYDRKIKDLGVDIKDVVNYPYKKRKWLDAFPSTLLSFYDLYIIKDEFSYRLPRAPEDWKGWNKEETYIKLRKFERKPEKNQ